MHEFPPEVRQATVTLPYFHEQVPMLYMRDGTPYVPVAILCRILGVDMKTQLPRWRSMFFWECARKLPLQIYRQGKQLVWCLHIGALPFWYGTLNSKSILPERREQLQQATRELVLVPEIMYQEKLRQYQRLRRFLFSFFTTYTDTAPFFEQIVLQVAPFLNEESQVWLEELIAHGQDIITEALTVAQKILHEQESFPLIEAYRLDHYGSVVETGLLPLLPVISSEDQAQFARCLIQLREWYEDLTAFLKEQKEEGE